MASKMIFIYLNIGVSYKSVSALVLCKYCETPLRTSIRLVSIERLQKKCSLSCDEKKPKPQMFHL